MRTSSQCSLYTYLAPEPPWSLYSLFQVTTLRWHSWTVLMSHIPFQCQIMLWFFYLKILITVYVVGKFGSTHIGLVKLNSEIINSASLPKECFAVSWYKFFTTFVKFISKYIIFFDAIVMELFFLISFLVCLLLQHRNTIDFCVLILYPATFGSHSLVLVVFWWIL